MVAGRTVWIYWQIILADGAHIGFLVGGTARLRLRVLPGGHALQRSDGK